MTKPVKQLYEFGPFRLDAEERLLLRDGQVVPLPPKVFEILLAMVQKSGRVLDKDELIGQIWPDTFVEEGNLARNVSTLRRALGESEEGHQYIETIPRRGYRFVAKVKELSDGTLIVRERSSVTIEQEEETGDEGDESLRSVIAPAEVEPAEVEPAESAPADAQAVAAGRRTRLSTHTKQKRGVAIALASVAIAAALVSSFFLGKRAAKQSPPAFHQLTFRNGTVWSAKFAPDGQNIIYSAMWEGRPSELFTTRLESPESRSLGLTNIGVLAISSSAEMAVLLNPRVDFTNRGTLARMPLAGGAPREVLTEVMDADWSPDGKELAVVHWEGNACRIEFPIGNVMAETNGPGWFSHVRVSPRGDQIAFINHPVARFDDAGEVVVMDRTGSQKTIFSPSGSAFGLEWSPDGDEIFITATDRGTNCDLHAVTLSGKDRIIARAAGRLTLCDVSRDGRLLVTSENSRIGISGLSPGETKERDLSWLDGSWARDISNDGARLLLDEEGEGGGVVSSVYLRRMDGSPAIRLGDGHAMALSPDGKWALAHLRYTKPQQIVLLPTGAGESKVLVSDATNFFETATWFPDSNRVLLRGREPGHGTRCYAQDITGGDPRPVLQEGLVGRLISPDGKSIIASARGQKRAIYPLEGGEARPVAGLEDEDFLLSWSADGRFLYVSQGSMPAKVFKLDLTTGRREFLREITPSDPTGLVFVSAPLMSPDGQSYAYTYFRVLNQLFLVDTAN